VMWHIWFAVEVHDPAPPLSDMQTVEADTPQGAVEALVNTGRVPQTGKLYRWARVVIESVDGKPTKALRFPVAPEAKCR
jgi:hypothetical protein